MANLVQLAKKSMRLKRAPVALPPAWKAPRPVSLDQPIPLPANLLTRLNALRRKYRSVAVLTGAGVLIATLCALLLGQAVSDWFFDLPWIARAAFLVGDIVVLGLIYRRFLDRPIRRRLTLSQTALLVEKKWPKVQQSLVAAVELSEGRVGTTRGSRQLVDVVLQQARARTTALNFGDVVSTRVMQRWLGGAAGALVVAGGIAALTWPASLSLMERLALLNVPLPTKTIVVPVTANLVVPVGNDVELVARAKGVIPRSGRVTITYPQGLPQDISMTVKADEPATYSVTMHNVQASFRYSFFLNDGHGPEFTVTAKVPPAMANLECEQQYPSYTGLPPQKLAPTELSLLPGGHLKITAACSDPLKSARVFLQGQNDPIEATVDGDGTHLEAEIPIPVRDVTGFSVHLVDRAGVNSTDETIYPITLVPDQAPVVKITQPATDQETITIRAKPPIDFDARDDYGLVQLALKLQLAKPPVAGESAAAQTAVVSIPIKTKPASEGHTYEYVIDVAGQVPPWKEGDKIDYWIEATDNNTATGPGVTKTEPKHFTVISIAAKQAEIFARVRKNAEELKQISATQDKINNDVKEAIPGK